jgi:predicted PurR-regulated permease PerM
MRRSFDGSRLESARSLSLIGIFVLLVFYTLYFAASLVLPIYLAILLSFALSPLVRGLQRVWIPAPLGAAVVLILFISGAGYAVTALSEPATEWIARGPSAFRQIERRLRVLKQPLAQVTQATESVEQLASVDGKPTTTVEVRQTSLAQSLFERARGFLAQAGLVLVLLYFLLASAGAFSNRLAKAFPSELGEGGGVGIIKTAESEISRYLLSISLINAGLGVAVAFAMYLLDMPSPVLWGAMAGVLNFIPFVGAMASAAIIAAVSLLTFDSLGRAVLAPVFFLGLTTIEGFFVTPALVGRRLLLNPIAILLALFVCSWMWGAAGALIAVPTLAIFKIVCDRIDAMRPVAILIDP